MINDHGDGDHASGETTHKEDGGDDAVDHVGSTGMPLTRSDEGGASSLAHRPKAAQELQDEPLPEWARKRITRANAEAANYRTRLREAETRLEGAKTSQEYEAAVADIKARNMELEQQLIRERVARKYHLPDDLATRLRGATTEELEADAKALQKYAAPAEPVVLSGGLNPADDSDTFDPVKEARKARAARR